MDNNEIKKENRKALPKFIIIMVISLLVGGSIGFCAAKYEMNTLAGSMKSAGAFFGTYIAPWLMLAAAVIVPIVCVPIYQSAKKLLSSWDGENEEISDSVDKKLSIYYMDYKRNPYSFLLSHCGFLFQRFWDF